jgi:hypothetical protein
MFAMVKMLLDNGDYFHEVCGRLILKMKTAAMHTHNRSRFRNGVINIPLVA